MDKKEKEWWQNVDWSQMDVTYARLQPGLKKKVDEQGHWSLGKGNFEKKGEWLIQDKVK